MMKKVFILVQVIGLTMLMACKSGNSGNNGGNAEQPYGEKSGIVTYKPMDMMGVKVTQTLYFDDYGQKEMRETMVEGNMNGMEMRQHTIDLRDGKTMYHYELENKAAGQDRATKNVYKSVLTAEMLESMNIGSLTPKMKARLGYKEEGKETVAGLEGIKYSVAPDTANPSNRVTAVQYKNIQLKISMGQMEIVAEKADFDVNVPADKFKIPEGYTVIEEPTQQMPQAEAPAAEPEKK